MSAFRIVSKALQVFASFLLFGGRSLLANTSCDVTDRRMLSSSEWGELTSGRERVDPMVSFVNIVCVIKEKE